MAFGGIMAAVAIVIMCMGGLIPVATYVCPMLCCLLLQIMVKTCGSRIGWGWFGTVSILALLMAPDKEAAAVFLCIGYYPIVKPKLDRFPLPWLPKGILFNASIMTMYWILIHVVGLDSVAEEFREFTVAMTAVLLVLGNVTFFLLDRLLSRNILGSRKK
jgi:hypothetical protein